jgi:hypothetical protein
MRVLRRPEVSVQVRRNSGNDVYEPVGRLDPVLVDHEMNVRSTVVVIFRVYSSHLHNAVRVSVPTAAEPCLAAVEGTGGSGFVGEGGVPAVHTGRIGW